MTFWSYVFLKLGLLLFVVGAGPAIVAGLFFPSADVLIISLLSLSVAPIGLLCLATGIILWIAGRLTR